MAFCSKCGASMEDDSRFCMMCGTPRETQPVMDTSAVNPVPVMETPTVNPAPVMDTPTVNPAPVMDTPAVNPVQMMDTPAVNPIPVMETPAVNPVPVMDTSAENAVADENVEKVAVSLSKESQPEAPQGEFIPVQPETSEGGFVPAQPGASQGEFIPVQPEIPQGGFAPVQPEVPQGGFVPIQSAPQQTYNTQSAYQQQYSAVPAEPARKKKGPVIAALSIGIVAIAAIIVAVVLLLNKAPVEIDLSNYVIISYDGYDTTGTARVSVDETKLLVDILKAQGEDATNTNKVSFSMKALINSIEVEQTEYTDLSNGQKISITVKYDQLLMEENDVEFKNGTKDYTVEDLVELIEVDPFKDITLKFSGTSPEGYVYYENSSDIECVRWATMEFDKDNGLKNGDTVTLRVKPAAIENAVEKGYRFTTTSKDYKVEGLDFYYNSIDEISAEHMKEYEAEAKQTFEDAMSWASYVEVSDAKVIGTYFAKSTVYSSNNMIIFVYTATIKSTEGYFDPTTIYVPVYMKVSCIEDGKLGYIWGGTDGFMTTETGYGSCTGYVSGDLMYTEYIIKNLSKDDYEVVATKGMPEFKEVEGKNVLPAPGQSGAQTETPSTETPSTETPSTETPSTETPTTDAPVEDAESNN